MLCNVSFTSIWRALFAAPLFLTVVFIWITPWYPSVVLTGRVREISVALLIIFLGNLFWFYYFVYLITHKMTEAVELQAQNQLLGMENARYRELREHMDATRPAPPRFPPAPARHRGVERGKGIRQADGVSGGI